MAYLTVEEANKAAKKAVESSVKTNFAEISSGGKTLRLESVEFSKDSDPLDYEGQKNFKLEGRTWGASVYGTFSLTDETGKLLDRGKVKLFTLPQMTARHTYLHGGQEYQFDTQLRRKPGIYTRISDRGEYVSQISAEGKFFRKMEVFFDPETKLYTLRVGTMSVPFSVLLHTMGVSPAEFEMRVGSDVARANFAVRVSPSDIKKLEKALYGDNTDSPAERIRTALNDSKMDPDATEYTTGHRLSAINKDAILAIAEKLLKLVQGRTEEDDPNSLVTKSVLSYDDYLSEWITKQAPEAKRKIAQKLPLAKKVSEAVPSGVLSPAISKLIMSPLAQRREQHNILDIVSGTSRTTVRGPGGISDPNMIRDDMRTIHPSHMGFLDPIKTPEGAAIGTTLHIAQTAYKQGNDLVAAFYDVQEGKEVRLTPKEVFNSVVAFPDEYDFSTRPPKPKRNIVKASLKGEIGEYRPQDVKYVPASPLSLFTTTTNAIPFLRSNIGVRAMTASRQIEQAIPLQNREAPLVQTRHGVSRESTEQVLGREVGSSVSPVDGTVKSIGRGKIIISGDDGKTYTVSYYRDFPLNNYKGYINSEVKVREGDRVKKGQVIADTNFTKDGVLALGTNLTVAYTPWAGLTFEDAVVISESAAKKLASEHMHQFEIELDETVITGKKKYASYFPNEINTYQLAKLDEDGVIEVGQKVDKGDFLFAALGEKNIDPDSEAVLRVSKGAVGSYSDRSIRWEKSYPGVVSGVERLGKKIVIHVKTIEPAVEGDKIVGRHGNKGIISKVVPDEEMLRGEDGKPFDIVMNPAGIVGRVNLGQVYETLVGKVAAKVGKPIVIDNYDDSEDTHDVVEKLLKKYGVSDTEIVTDPKEGPTEKPVLTGVQYIFKLTHQVDKKLSARGAVSKHTGERLKYSTDMTPARGGEDGGQTIGILDTYALLAHGATANLKEMFTYKGDAQNAMFWTRLKNGGVLPEAETPYTSKKFLAMLEGMGVHVKKDGDKLQFMPLTDRDIEKMSAGALKKPGMALDSQRRPEKEGIFDPMKTGGLKGSKWAHIELPNPVLNPIATDAVKRILGYVYPEYGANIVEKIMEGKLGVSADGKIVAIEYASKVGGDALKYLLSKVDVDRTLQAAEEDLKIAPVSKINVYNKTVKYLRALKELGYRPDEAYMLTKVPVVPPEYRPITVDKVTGQVSQNDVNDLYKKLGATVEAVAGAPTSLPPESQAKRQQAIQDMVDALMVSGYSSPTRPLKSFMQQIVGSSPKYGFYHSKVLKRRQELSGRSTIVPNPELDMDMVEIPEKMLWETYAPFITRNLTQAGYSPSDAATHVKDKTEVARSALMEELKDRPVLLKRDPVLHKFGIQAFYAKPSPDDTIRIPPSVTSGFGADFDGDTMAVFVPATEQAKEEAKNLLPSKNLFSPKGGGLMHKPEHEAQLGLYLLTEIGNDSNLMFSEIEEALAAYSQRRLKLNTMFNYRGKKTTLGRLLLANSIPKGRVQEKWYNEIAYNPRFRMDKKKVTELLTQIGKIQPTEFPKVLMQLRKLGDQASFKLGGSVALKDFKPMKAANKVLPKDTSTEAKLKTYVTVREKIESKAKDLLRASNNNLIRMVDSGARGNWDQLKQITLSPGLLTNAKGEVVKTPINRSYSQGLSLAEYWTTLHGARRGMVSKVRGTALPGYLSRQMISSVADVKIVEDDCKTTNGVYESVTDRDIIGRYLAKAQKIGKTTYPAGTLLDANLIQLARTAGVQKLLVRTPMKCEAHDGVCAKCYGVWHDGNTPPVGTNIGVISSQSLSEPTTQMSMKLFHEGGLYTPASKTVDSFSKAKELLEVPQKLKDEAVLSRSAGKVMSIEQGTTGTTVVVGSVRHFVPKSKKVIVKKGETVRRGQPLSDGTVNPHGLMELVGVGAAQDHLVGELHSLFSPLGVDKRHTETVVRYMTSMGVVESAPEGSGFYRGDIVSIPQVEAFNKRFVPVEWALGKKLGEKYLQYGKGTQVTESIIDDLKKNNIKKVKIEETGYVHVKPVVRGVNTLPLVRTDDPLAKMSFENIKKSIETGTLMGSISDLSGKHPLPAVGFGKIAEINEWDRDLIYEY